MHKWFILAACCFAFTSAMAQDSSEPVVSSDEVSTDTGSGDDGHDPSLARKQDDKSGCGCGK